MSRAIRTNRGAEERKHIRTGFERLKRSNGLQMVQTVPAESVFLKSSKATRVGISIYFGINLVKDSFALETIYIFASQVY